jgi:ABC-type multidrug transport system fused ATPase/permease subunit
MAAPPTSTRRVAGAARSGVAGTIVAGVAFFDGVFIGAPIALLAASFRPSLVYVVATVVVVFLVIGCCRWVDRRWDDWFSGKNGTRIEKRLETMRASRLMAHPVAWIQRGSDRWYALAAAVANPILVATLARFVGGKPVGNRRILLGAVAYALPYVAMWSIVGFAFGETIRAI